MHDQSIEVAGMGKESVRNEWRQIQLQNGYRRATEVVKGENTKEII